MNVELTIECRGCGGELGATASISRGMYGYSKHKVIVNVCEKCVKSAITEAVKINEGGL